METEFLPTIFQQFIHTSRYAKWREIDGRRETWPETVDRYVNFMDDHLQANNDYRMPAALKYQLREAILNLEVLPSMRAIMTAGPALEQNHIAAYNCSYIPMDDLRAFDELLYILMNGTGVGYSVESKYVKQLPTLPETFKESPVTIVVDDSREGWGEGLRQLLIYLYDGIIPNWDVSQLRPAGARLKTFGGRSSGPDPLVELFEFVIKTATNAAGRKLTSLEVHDICCKIGDVVVVGGVRRSALISLTDLDDKEMALAKSGEWWIENPHRRLANNSVAYETRPTRAKFFDEWQNLIDSKSGERGIFNREAARKQAAKTGRRDADRDFGTNPCSEIILRPNQFCNLTTIVVREEDTLETLLEKAELATILGTFQASLTNFKYIRPIWKKNTEEEALLGVSMTGQFGNALLSGKQGFNSLADALERIKSKTISTNRQWARTIGINTAAAITCVKPEGTSSSLVHASSGMHAWHSKFIVRTARGDKKDPYTKFLIDAGMPVEDDIMSPDTTAVFSFPVRAPDGAMTRHDLTAIEHLELWLAYQRYYCEHKPSITVSVKEHEWAEVGEWVWKHFDEVSGIAFLPYEDHTYKQAPFQEVTEKQFNELVTQMPDNIEWDRLMLYELEDTTSNAQTLACTAGACEITDIGTPVLVNA